jgi:hypothetical protein
MNNNKMKTKELIELALHEAVSWELALMEAYHNEKNSTEYLDAKERVRKFRKILTRRYGRTETLLDEQLNKMPLVNIDDIRK